MTRARIQAISFFILLAIVGIIVFWFLRPFANILGMSLILTILLYPIFTRLRTRLKHPGLAAGLTVILTLLSLLLPLVFFGSVIYSEVNNLYNRVQNGEITLDRDALIQALPANVQNWAVESTKDLNDKISSITGNVLNSASAFLSNAVNFTIALFLLFFSMYYLLRDGDKIIQWLKDLFPLSNRKEAQLLHEISHSVNGIVKGSFLTALTQGVVATIGFFIFGMPEPFIWGAFTVVAALVPNVGTSISLIPAVLYLFVTGHVPQAIGLAIWGILAVGLIDNIIGPKLVGSQAKLHPLLVFLGILGGLATFGFVGFLIGPIIMAIFVTLLKMYRHDFAFDADQTEKK